MTIPLIKNVYKIDDKEVTVVAQTLFFKVYTMTYVNSDSVVGSQMLVYNWWKFMFKAKYLKQVPQLSKYY